MNPKTRMTGLVPAALVLATAVILPATSQASGYERTYHVSITNVTPGNQFTPVLAATHTSRAAFFAVGQPASDELAILAEGGDTGPLEGVLSSLNAVQTVSTTPGPSEGLTFAGETVEFQITGARYSRRFSMAAMILPTNDSFVALDSVNLPYRGSVTYYAVGYDAGSEDNDELCVNIPGPRCGMDGGSPEGEGFVHISSGIQGIGDLSASVYDWRNPVAKVTITRVR